MSTDVDMFLMPMSGIKTLKAFLGSQYSFELVGVSHPHNNSVRLMARQEGEDTNYFVFLRADGTWSMMRDTHID
jgi:hypothetical protein